MQEFSTKITGSSLTATEFNQIADELENIIKNGAPGGTFRRKR